MINEETIYPKLTQEGLMISCIINKLDNRDVMTTNILGDLLQTDMEGMVRVWLAVILAKIILKINTGIYRYKFIVDRGKKVIYVVKTMHCMGT